MSTIKAVIIDDEIDALESLSFELSHYCPQVSVLKQFNDPTQAIPFLQSEEIDVLFLDIEMPGMSGFELLSQLKKIEFEVVFVTAYDQFAIRAFEFNAIDYLLKPVQKDKLIQAVERIAKHQSSSLDKSTLKAIMTNIYSQTTERNKNIALPTSEGFAFVKVDDIVYVQAESNYCWVYTSNDTKYLLSKTLKSIEEMITSSQFIRVHQSYIINLDYAIKYVRGQGGYVVIKNNVQIPVSRSRKEELLSTLQSGF
jgi:two-component system LytT family response regulator